MDGIESRAIADFDLLLGQQEQLAAEQRRRLIQLERQKSKLIDAYMADALPVEDLKPRQTQVASEIADARRLIAESDIERTELNNRLHIVLAMLRKARQTYDAGDDKTRHLLNTAVFERFEVDSHDAGPTANGWTPQDPVVEYAELTEIIDALLDYHPGASLAAGPTGGPVASSTTRVMTSVNSPTPSGNSSVLPDTTSGYPIASDSRPLLTSKTLDQGCRMMVPIWAPSSCHRPTI